MQLINKEFVVIFGKKIVKFFQSMEIIMQSTYLLTKIITIIKPVVFINNLNLCIRIHYKVEIVNATKHPKNQFL